MNSASGVSQSVSNLPFNGDTYTIDKTAPTVSSITATLPSNTNPTNITIVTYTVTFSEAVTGVDASDFALTTSGTSGSVSGVSGSGSTYTVTVSSISGTGTLRLDLKSSGTGITDAAGNAISGGYTSGSVYTIDQTPPTVSSITAASPSNASPTNVTSVTYTIAFSEAVTGVDASDFTVTTSGVSGSVSGVSGSGSTYAVTVSSISGTGTLRLDLNSSGTGIADLAGNAISGGFTGGDTYTVDQTPPTVSIGAPSVSYANSTATISYTVTWSDANLNTSSISLSPAQLQFSGSGYAVNVGNIGITGSGNSRTISITGVTGDGSMSFSIPSGTASDLAGNSASASNTTVAVTIDNTAPTVVSLLATDGSLTTNATSLDYQITFSEPVTGVDATDFTAVTSGVSASDITVAPISSTVYDITINSVTGTGTVTLDLNSSGTGIQDLAANAIAGGFTGQTYNVDQTPPTVQSITATTPSNTNPTNATSVSYTVTFSEPVTGVSNIGFMATATNTVASTSITVTPVSSSVYTVSVNGISGDGTLRLDLNNANTGIFDLAGNPISGGFTSGDVYTIDNTAPGVYFTSYFSVNGNNRSASWAKVGDTIVVDIDYKETVQTPVVTIAGHSVPAVFESLAWGAYYVLTSADVEGPIAYDIKATDLAGNTTETSSASTGDYITFDKTPPTAMISAPSAASIVTGGPGTVTYTVTYADANFNTSNLGNSAITLITGGTANGTVNVTGSGTSYTVTISNITGEGTLGISVGAGNASDLAGNVDAGAGPSANFNVVTTDATLSNLAINVGKLTPVFSPGVTSYTRNVVNGVTSIMVTPTTSDPNATLTINNAEAASGSPTSVPLSVGSNTITITVTASDGTTTDTYTLTVTRAGSTDDLLSFLKLTNGVKIQIFHSNLTSYTANVVNGVMSTQVTPVAKDPNATILVNGTEAVASATASDPIALSVGPNTITVKVTAQDGVTSLTYTVVITRAAANNDFLASLKPSRGTLSPTFAPLNTAYNVSVVNGVSSMTVTPTTSDPGAGYC